jgi:cytidylate kinase
MIELTEEQRQNVLEGHPVHLTLSELGTACVVLRADVYERLQSVLEADGELDMRAVARLIERNMSEDDADDPLLEKYQDSGSSS